MTEASAAARIASLGALRRTFGPVPRSVKTTHTVGSICIVLGAVAFVGGIVLAITSDAGMLCLSAIGLALVAFGVWAVRRSQADASLSVALYNQGLVYSVRGDQQVYRWDDLSEIWQVIFTPRHGDYGMRTSHTYRLVAHDGRRLTLDDRVEGITELGQALQKAASPHQLEAALARFAQGETLTFGRLSVGGEGLTLGRRTLAWGDLASAQLSCNHVYITAKGRKATWAGLPVRELPNVLVLLALVEAHKSAAS
jgi:hypothetical protein